MKVGSKYKFYLPAALGWGERGNGSVIGPNAPVIFEVELVSIAPPTAPAAAPGGAAEGAQPQAAPKPAPLKKPVAKPVDKKPPV